MITTSYGDGGAMIFGKSSNSPPAGGESGSGDTDGRCGHGKPPEDYSICWPPR